jgi:tetratricopeptide (TPR) repeat protein
MAGVAGLAWDWPGVRASMERAVELAPGSAEARHQLGISWLRTGHRVEALRQARLAVQLDPLAYTLVRDGCLVAVHAGEFDEAVALCRRALDLRAGHALPAVNLGRALLALGRERDAIEVFVGRLPAWRRPFARIGIRVLGLERSFKLLNWWVLLAAGEGCTALPENGALFAAVTGDRERMYTCLEEAADQRRVPLPLTEPSFEPYRSEPRFEAYLQRIRLLP